MSLLGNHQPSGTPSVITAARFKVQADFFHIAAYFTDLSGITSEIEPATYVVSNSRQSGSTMLTKQFGMGKPPTVVLRRGVDGSGEIWMWHKMAMLGADVAKVHATLTMMDASGADRGVYDLECAWPIKVEVSGLKAGAGEVVYESVTLTCDSITYIPNLRSMPATVAEQLH